MRRPLNRGHLKIPMNVSPGCGHQCARVLGQVRRCETTINDKYDTMINVTMLVLISLGTSILYLYYYLYQY